MGVTDLIPAEGPGARDEERLRVRGEENLPCHAHAVAENGDEVWGDMGHGGMRVREEDIICNFDGTRDAATAFSVIPPDLREVGHLHKKPLVVAG